MSAERDYADNKEPYQRLSVEQLIKGLEYQQSYGLIKISHKNKIVKLLNKLGNWCNICNKFVAKHRG